MTFIRQSAPEINSREQRQKQGDEKQNVAFFFLAAAWKASNLNEGLGSVVKNLPANVDPWFRNIPWRMEWQPTPVFLPGKFHGQRSLVDCSPGVCKELDTTEHTCNYTLHFFMY